jgi:hypothetical protein
MLLIQWFLILLWLFLVAVAMDPLEVQATVLVTVVLVELVEMLGLESLQCQDMEQVAQQFL